MKEQLRSDVIGIENKKSLIKELTVYSRKGWTVVARGKSLATEKVVRFSSF